MAKAARLNLAEGLEQGRQRRQTKARRAAGPSRLASCAMARPALRAGQPQKKGNKIRHKEQINNSFLEKRKKNGLFPFCLAEA